MNKKKQINESTIKGNASLVLGLLRLILFLMPYLTIPFSIMGIVLSSKQNKHYKTSNATAGLILSIIGLVIGAVLGLITLFVGAFVSTLM